MISIPIHIRAFLFDLDGVLTKTDTLHAAAWKEMFDSYLMRSGSRFKEFNSAVDYIHVDGVPRTQGVRNFLQSRGIVLPEGSLSDSPEQETVNGLASWKNILFQRNIEKMGVEVYGGSIEFVRTVRAAGLPTAVVSSSANCRIVLEAANIADLFDVRIDAQSAATLDLPGKPAPAMFIEAAHLLHVNPKNAAVVEDTYVGVMAGRAGDFGFVVGVDRGGRREMLYQSGADEVVSDLAQLSESVRFR